MQWWNVCCHWTRWVETGSQSDKLLWMLLCLAIQWISLVCQEKQTCLTVWLHGVSSVKFGGVGSMVWCCSGFGLDPSLLGKRTLSALAFRDVFQLCGNNFGMTPSTSSMTVTLCISALKAWMRGLDVEELDQPAESPKLNPIEHSWDELEQVCEPHHKYTSWRIFRDFHKHTQKQASW